MTSKAPAGGVVSPVNGQFYEGGEFTPDTGLYCGKKGAKRAAKRDKFAANGRYIEMVSPETPGAGLFEITSEGYPIGVVVALNNLQAVAAFPGRKNLNFRWI